ncbi:RNA12 protein-domain-containing protein [Thamnocephalis sphaerospora]|uniref:Mitochondrial escape protein 2 n=1 Tax=Thamnocephalis sphaerospora TaxID=78915 RepID=A0A4P9XUV6_9FUNG|nr:RNA12 protein-domain-containing protein [Thamnocephalis sphaerospora]|eukprot:RKP09762.1 RNA12 protein-domain-containing protein [Thamnocephalis sphaerospora]
MLSALVAAHGRRPAPSSQWALRCLHAGHARADPRPHALRLAARIGTRRAVSTAPTLPPHDRRQFQIYLDNVYPLRFSSQDPRFAFYTRQRTNAAAGKVRDYLQQAAQAAAAAAREADPDPVGAPTVGSGLPFNATLGDALPRVKDGGLLLTVHYDLPARAAEAEQVSDTSALFGDPAQEEAADEIVAAIRDLLQEGPRAWFNLRRSRAFLVRGQPFVEDLASHYPSKRLRVELYNNDLQQAPRPERVYGAFREFGRIVSIRMPPPTSYFPRAVLVRYNDRRAAAAAKNCLHGYRQRMRSSATVPAHFSIQYEPNVKLIRMLMDWLMSHPRVTLPIIVALVAAITYTVFDPMRIFFIRQHAEGTFDFGRYANDLHHLGKRISHHMGHRTEAAEDRQKSEATDEAQLGRWLAEPPSTFIVVDGPPGSGKTSLVNRVLQSHGIYLCIDCDALLTARDNQETVERLASQIGYIPQFRILSKISAMVDSMINVTTGASAGFSSDTRERIKEILGTCAEALEEYGKDSWLDKLLGERGPNRKHYLYAAMKDDGPPERRDYPIVILDGFFNTEGEHDDQIWRDLATWANVLVERNIAHVVFVCRNGAAAELPLNQAMPNRSFNVISLRDGGPSVALQYVRNRLSDHAVPVEELIPCVEQLGGRLTDLESFVQKIIGGLTPEAALKDIVYRSEAELRKYVTRDPTSYDAVHHATAWSSLQFWHMVTLLADHEQVSYDAVRQHPLFDGNDEALRGMERADLIHLERRHGRPFSIVPAKNIYRVAFQRMCRDERLRLWMESRTLGIVRTRDAAKVTRCEEELRTLGEIVDGLQSLSVMRDRAVLGTLESRIRSLAAMMQKAADKVNKVDMEMENVRQRLSNICVPEEDVEQA